MKWISFNEAVKLVGLTYCKLFFKTSDKIALSENPKGFDRKAIAEAVNRIKVSKKALKVIDPKTGEKESRAIYNYMNFNTAKRGEIPIVKAGIGRKGKPLHLNLWNRAIEEILKSGIARAAVIRKSRVPGKSVLFFPPVK